MFRQQHFQDQLTAYAHGELSAAETARVAAHLDRCARCRAEFERIASSISLLESLTPEAAPASLWETIEAALAQQESSRAAEQTKRMAQKRVARQSVARGASPAKDTARRGSWLGDLFAVRFAGRRAAAMAGFVLLLVLGAGAAFRLYVRTPPGAGWEVARLAGAPLIDADRIESIGRLRIGDWLETDADSRAQIKVADIGQVEIDPGTRVRLVETRQTEHRLELARGRMHATIFAPPRLFFVNTPSAVAADLGCAYTLEVDDAGRSRLYVTSGWVAFETKERESIVPAGAACLTEPGAGPGTPFFADAPKLFLDALAKFDFAGGGTEALSVVIAEARTRDTLTLWHLLARTDGDARARVYERLAALAPPPPAVTREGIMLLDPAMLYEWKAQMEQAWLWQN